MTLFNLNFLVVNQLYTVNVMDESVLRGNTAILKCHIPSFVADYVFVSGWISNDGDEYSINANQADGIDQNSLIILEYSKFVVDLINTK